MHVHMNYGGAYRNDPAHLGRRREAEDLHVVEDLIVNKEQRIPDMALLRRRASIPSRRRRRSSSTTRSTTRAAGATPGTSA